MKRDMLARRMERKGYVVGVAESVQRLLEQIKREGADVVLLDIEMPDMSGLEALKTLREAYSPIELPVIMVTAKSQSEDIVKALDLGENDYLTKPVEFAVGLARRATQLSLKRAHEALRESEERYALAARGANDGLWDWNLLTNVMYFSPRWKSMLGYHEDEIGDKLEEWLDRIHDSDRERVKDELAAHRKGLTPHFESEQRALNKDGTFRWMLSRRLDGGDASGNATRRTGPKDGI